MASTVTAVGDPIAGISTYFALGDGATPTEVVTDVSDFLDGVEPSEDVDELDGTTFRRPARNIIAGFRTVGYSLSGKWSAAAHEFFAPLRGLTDLAFEYGPEGKDVGMVLISGTCNLLSYSGPVASHDAVTTFTVELRIVTQTDGTIPVVGGLAGEGAGRGAGDARRPGADRGGPLPPSARDRARAEAAA